VDVQVHEIEDAAKKYSLKLSDCTEDLSNAEIQALLESLSPDSHWKLAAKGGCQDVFFLSTLDKVPQLIQTAEEAAGRLGYAAADMGIYVQPQHQGSAQHVELSFFYDPANRSEVAKIKSVYEAVSRALVEGNAYFSRPYGLWADLVYSRDATATRVLRVAKRIVDPQQVLNPGKLCF
jgi:hypothetical protein